MDKRTPLRLGLTGTTTGARPQIKRVSERKAGTKCKRQGSEVRSNISNDPLLYRKVGDSTGNKHEKFCSCLKIW